MDGFEEDIAEAVRKISRDYWSFVAEYGGVMTEAAFIRARVLNELEYAIRRVAERENAGE